MGGMLVLFSELFEGCVFMLKVLLLVVCDVVLLCVVCRGCV